MIIRLYVRHVSLTTVVAVWLTGLATVMTPTVASASAVTLPTPTYTVSVNSPSITASPMKYTGRGSWTNVELLNGQLAAPLFKLGTDEKVPFRSSIIVGGLGGATKIRAGLDGVSGSGDACRGSTETEQAALTAYVWDGSAWGSSTGTLETHPDETGTCKYLGVTTSGATHVMFVVDLFCRDTADGSPTCDSVDGQPAGGTSMLIEVEGSGDGVYNSPYTTVGSINVNSQTRPSGSLVTLVTADGSDADNDPDPHGLRDGDVINGVAGCDGRSFAVTVVDSSTFTVTGDCASDGVGANIRKVARGDEAYEVVLSTESVQMYDEASDSMINGLTDDSTLFTERLVADISTISLASNVATITTSGNHGFLTGDSITVDGVASPNDDVFNGTHEITKVNETTFTFAKTNDDVASGASVGTATYSEFANWIGLMQVPTCANDADAGPCLVASPSGSHTNGSPEYNSGWQVMLLDELGKLTVRPWRSAHPFYVTVNTSVSFSLRLPRSEVGSERWFRNYLYEGAGIANGLSIAMSAAQIDSYTYTAGNDFDVLTVNLTAKELSTVSRFDVTADGNGFEFFTDRCTDYLRVGPGGIVYVDANENSQLDAGEQNAADCQNETEGFEIDQVVLWGDSGGSADRAWMRASGHDFAVGDTVTVCCAYGAFDGKQTVVAVGDPYAGSINTTNGATTSLGWFAFGTSSGSFDNASFPRADGSNDPGYEVVTARAVKRSHIRATATTVTLDLRLTQAVPECPAGDAGCPSAGTPSTQHIAGGYISTNAQAISTGPAMNSPTPAFDFGVAGPSRRANGTARTTDGFFRACIPAGFLVTKWLGISSGLAAERINGRSASASANRNGALTATTATCGVAGGVLVVLSQFGFSAPYFAISPVASGGGGGGSGSGGTVSPTCGPPPLPPCGVGPGLSFGPGGQIQNPNALRGSDMVNLRPDNFAGFRPDDTRVLPPDALRNFRPDQMGALPPSAMGGFNRDQINNLSPAAMAGLSGDQLRALAPEAMAGFRPDQMAQLPPEALAGIDRSQFAQLPPTAMAGFSARQLAQLPIDAVAALDATKFGELPPAAMAGFDVTKVQALPVASVAAFDARKLAQLPPAAISGLDPTKVQALPPSAMSGFRADQMTALPPAAIRAFDTAKMQSLAPSAMAGLDATKMQLLSPQLLTVVNPSQLAEVPPAAIEVLRVSQLSALTPQAMTEFRSAQFAALSPQAMQAVKPSQIAALAPQALSGMEPEQIRVLPPSAARALTGAQLAAVPPEALAAIPPGVFKSLGEAARNALTPEQRTALPAEALSPPALSQPATADNIGAVVASISGWNIDQVPPSAFAGIRPNDLARLPVDAFTAISPRQLASLPPTALGALRPTQMASMPPEVIAAIRPSQIAAMPNSAIGAMSPAQASALPTDALAGIRSAQVRQMPTAAIEVLNPEQVSAIPSAAVRGIKPAQLTALSTEALSALGAGQVGALRPAALAALEPEQVSALPAPALRQVSDRQVRAMPLDVVSTLSPGQLAAMRPSAFAGLSTGQAEAMSASQASAFSAADLRRMTPAVRSIVAQLRSTSQ